MEDEMTSLGSNYANECLTLLLGGNAAGNFKLKPLLVYHSETPKALKGYAKPNLPVIWRSNKKAWVTTSIFQDWFCTYFCPAVEKYCAQNNIAHKVLLILDNSTCHPGNLNDLSQHVRVEFLPKNTKTRIQPMDQGVKTTFKAYYLRRLINQFKREMNSENKPTVREYWQNYNIKNAIENIYHSWNDLTLATMNGVWAKLWPECVQNLANYQEKFSDLLKSIVDLARDVGFEDLAEADLVKWLESHQPELSNEDLLKLEKEREALIDDEDNVETTPAPRQLSLNHLSNSFTLLEKAMVIYRENDPCRERSTKVCQDINNAVLYYKELYQEKLKRALQTSDLLLEADTNEDYKIDLNNDDDMIDVKEEPLKEEVPLVDNNNGFCDFLVNTDHKYDVKDGPNLTNTLNSTWAMQHEYIPPLAGTWTRFGYVLMDAAKAQDKEGDLKSESEETDS